MELTLIYVTSTLNDINSVKRLQRKLFFYQNIIRSFKILGMNSSNCHVGAGFNLPPFSKQRYELII